MQLYVRTLFPLSHLAGRNVSVNFARRKPQRLMPPFQISCSESAAEVSPEGTVPTCDGLKGYPFPHKSKKVSIKSLSVFCLSCMP